MIVSRETLGLIVIFDMFHVKHINISTNKVKFQF